MNPYQAPRVQPDKDPSARTWRQFAREYRDELWVSYIALSLLHLALRAPVPGWVRMVLLGFSAATMAIVMTSITRRVNRE